MKLRSWYSCYGTKEIAPSVQEMLGALSPPIKDFEFRTPTGMHEWKTGEFWASGEAHPAILLRRLTSSDQELSERIQEFPNWLSAYSDEPNLEMLLSAFRQVRQVIHVQPVPGAFGPSKMARICEQLCGYFSSVSEGFIQVYQEGFFTMYGESLLPYNPVHTLKTSVKKSHSLD